MTTRRSSVRMTTIANHPQTIFVYGTLRPDIGTNAKMIDPAVVVGPALIEGKLYDMGGFPAAVYDPDSAIRGWLLSCSHMNDNEWYEFLKALDLYEGNPHLFRRIVVDVVMEDDSTDTLRAQAYFFAKEGLPPLYGALIESGDWADVVCPKESSDNAAQIPVPFN